MAEANEIANGPIWTLTSCSTKMSGGASRNCWASLPSSAPVPLSFIYFHVFYRSTESLLYASDSTQLGYRLALASLIALRIRLDFAAPPLAAVVFLGWFVLLKRHQGKETADQAAQIDPWKTSAGAFLHRATSRSFVTLEITRRSAAPRRSLSRPPSVSTVSDPDVRENSVTYFQTPHKTH